MMTTETKPTVDLGPRCLKCNKMLANLVARPWNITCNRCKATNTDSQPQRIDR